MHYFLSSTVVKPFRVEIRKNYFRVKMSIKYLVKL